MSFRPRNSWEKLPLRDRSPGGSGSGGWRAGVAPSASDRPRLAEATGIDARAARTRALARIFGAIWLSHESWGWFQPAIALYREARSAMVEGSGTDARAESARALTLAGTAWFLSLIGSPDLGITMASEGLATLKRHDADLFLAVNAVNINAIFLNRLDLAESASGDLLEYATRKGDPYAAAFAHVWLAFTGVAMGHAESGERHAVAASEAMERSRNPFGLAVVDGIVVGLTHLMRGDLERARHAYERGLRAAGAIGYRRVIQLAHDSLSTIALLEGRLAEARASFLGSLRITYADGQPREQLGSLRDLATVYAKEGDAARAIELLAVVLNHPGRTQNPLSRPESLGAESTRLLQEVASLLPADRYDRARHRGATLELGSVVEELLRS